MLNVALVGAGRHSTSAHAPALHRAAERLPALVRLSAVCDLDLTKAERAREAFGFERAFGDIGTMLREARPDAVVCVTPIAATVEAARRFIAAGVPVCIEKPLGTDLAEARSLAALAGEREAPVMVSLNRRFCPGLRAGLEEARRRGRIRYVHGTMLRHDRREPDFLWGTGIHLLDLLCSIAGPATLSAAASVGGAARTGLLTGADGAAVSFEIFPVAGRDEDRIRLAGEDYCVDVWTGPVRPWRVEVFERGECVTRISAPPDEPPFVWNGTYDETVAFLTAVAQQRPPRPSVADALPATELADHLQNAV